MLIQFTDSAENEVLINANQIAGVFEQYGRVTIATDERRIIVNGSLEEVVSILLDTEAKLVDFTSTTGTQFYINPDKIWYITKKSNTDSTIYSPISFQIANTIQQVRNKLELYTNIVKYIDEIALEQKK